MERSFKRISETLKLPQDSRERIRSQLVSCQTQQEDIPMKKVTLKRIPLLVAAVIAAMTLTLTAGAAVVQQLFRNDIIVSSKEDIPDPANENAPAAVGIVSPIGNPPHSLDEMIETDRAKSDDWPAGERLGGSGGALGYNNWDYAEVLSSDPTLRIRRVTRASDSAEKMEYTAENPANLMDTLTGRVTFDLSWMGEHYNYVPDANLAYVVTDKNCEYVSELCQALYTKPDESGYVRVGITNLAQAESYSQSYIIDGSYETAYYYTSSDGYEFLIKMHNGIFWADCNTSHANVSLYGAYLTSGEIEDILDNLSLSIEG